VTESSLVDVGENPDTNDLAVRSKMILGVEVKPDDITAGLIRINENVLALAEKIDGHIKEASMAEDSKAPEKEKEPASSAATSKEECKCEKCKAYAAALETHKADIGEKAMAALKAIGKMAAKEPPKEAPASSGAGSSSSSEAKPETEKEEAAKAAGFRAEFDAMKARIAVLEAQPAPVKGGTREVNGTVIEVSRKDDVGHPVAPTFDAKKAMEAGQKDGGASVVAGILSGKMGRSGVVTPGPR
jgi:hypothetical protein